VITHDAALAQEKCRQKSVHVHNSAVLIFRVELYLPYMLCMSHIAQPWLASLRCTARPR
jgi:hypothetical protein